MSQHVNFNPWLSMWSQPRVTIRSIVHSKPNYGVYTLAAVFVLQAFFFYANWWSLGLQLHFKLILLLALFFAPFIGFAWLYFTTFLFSLTGKLLHGSATFPEIKAALAWSKIPSFLGLCMWAILIISKPNLIFIQDASQPSSVFINFITLALLIWSFILLLQGIKEVQRFSFLKAFFNILAVWLIANCIYLLSYLLLRYLYLTL